MTPLEDTRTCRDCGETFPLDRFALDRRRVGGVVRTSRRHLCLPCAQVRNTAYHRAAYARNPRRILTRKRRWAAAHPEREIERKRRYNQDNREKVAAGVRNGRARRAARLEAQRTSKLAALAAEQERRNQQKAARVLAVIVDTWEITQEALVGTSRDPYLVGARRIAAYILQVDLEIGPSEVGRLLKKDHSTCLHHRAVLEQRIATGTLSYEDCWSLGEVRRLLGREAVAS